MLNYQRVRYSMILMLSNLFLTNPGREFIKSVTGSSARIGLFMALRNQHSGSVLVASKQYIYSTDQ
jgi:hypothetical protein